MSRGCTRRNLLRGAAGAALALPFLNHFSRRSGKAEAATGDKKVILFFTPNNSQMRSFWLPQQSGPSLVIPSTGEYVLSPMLPHINHLTCLDNLAAPYLFNHAGTAAMLAGTFTVGGAINDHEGDYSPFGPTFTYALAPHLRKAAPYEAINLGFHPEGETILYKDIHAPVFYEDNPAAELSKYFQNLAMPNPLIEAQRARKKSAIDAVIAEVGQLQARVGKADRDRLQHYLDSLRDVELQIGANLSCAAPNIPSQSAWSIPDLCKAQIDILVAAMACGLSNVGNFVIGRAGHDDTYSFLANTYDFGNAATNTAVNNLLSTTGMHGLTHGVTNTSTDQGKAIFVISRWYMTQLKYLVDRLIAYGILGDTVILSVAELGQGGHDLSDRASMNVTLVDGANLFKKGYYSAAPVAHNDTCVAGSDVGKCPTNKEYLASVYTTLAHALGINITIGDAYQQQRVMTELIA